MVELAKVLDPTEVKACLDEAKRTWRLLKKIGKQQGLAQANVWWDFFCDHKGHPGIDLVSSPLSLTLQLKCSCSPDMSVEIKVRDFKGLPRLQRLRFSKFFEALAQRGRKARRKQEHKARQKAKALLHRYLTKEQRWQLRASHAFRVQGADNHVYEIREKEHGNVYRVSEDGFDYNFCLVADNVSVPVYDLMLTQKLLLEKDIEGFLKQANKTLIQPKGVRRSGVHLENIVEDILDNPDDHGLEICQFADKMQEMYRQEKKHRRILAELKQRTLLSVLNFDPLSKGTSPAYAPMIQPSGDRTKSFSWFVDWDGEIRAAQGGTIVLPLHSVDETDPIEAAFRLFTAVGATVPVVHSIEEVEGYFEAITDDPMRHFGAVLLNPQTAMEADYCITYADERIPVGIVYCFIDQGSAGIHACYEDGRYGLMLHQNSMVVYKPRVYG